MPELPEVETVRRDLDSLLRGKVAASVKVTGARTVRRQRPSELRRRVEGRTFMRADRRGKYLALVLDDDQVLVIHLRMSGQLLWVAHPAAVPKAPHTHVVMALRDGGGEPGDGGRPGGGEEPGGGGEVRFVDPRTFGEWYVTADVRPDGLPVEFDRFGPDPLVDKITAKVLGARLANKRTAVKVALTDQRVIAGIGNIYADEICHAARVRPDRRCESLDETEVRALSRSLSSILRAAVTRRGSSLKDASYRDLMGDPGEYQHDHRVYGRLGQPCYRCGAPIERVRIGARVAYGCLNCQS